MRDMKYGLLLILLSLLNSAQNAAAGPKDQALASLNLWSKSVQAKPSVDNEEKEVFLELVSSLRIRIELASSLNELKGNSEDEVFIFALRSLLDIEASPARKPHSRIRGFALNLSEIFEHEMEKNESALKMAQNYFSFGGMIEPAKVEEFSKARAYRNSKDSEAAAAFDLEAAGTAADLDSLQLSTPVPEESLGSEELLETLDSKLSTIAGELETTKGKADIRPNKIIPSDEAHL